MTRVWDDYLGNSPALYARKVLKDCGLREPPIDERIVTDYLGLEVKEIPKSYIREFFGNLKQRVIETACAMLVKRGDRGIIFYNGETRVERRRMSIVHECGHDLIPWHDEYAYCCSDNEIDAETHKRVEREAFSCGSEILMPKQLFVEDALSLEIGISSIEQLRRRYIASMEAAAIWYALTYPGPCGMVMLEPSANRKITKNAGPAPGQLILPCRFPPRPDYPFNTEKYPLSVKYSVYSYFFPKYIRPGQGIEAENLLFDAWHNQRRMRGEVPAVVFGSSAKWSYNAECLPLGESGKMIVLLWLPDRQMKLNFGHRGLM